MQKKHYFNVLFIFKFKNFAKKNIIFQSDCLQKNTVTQREKVSKARIGKKKNISELFVVFRRSLIKLKLIDGAVHTFHGHGNAVLLGLKSISYSSD